MRDGRRRTIRCREHVGLDGPGHDLDDADPELGDLGRERLAQRGDRRLRRPIGAEERHGSQLRRRRDVADDSATSRPHPRHCSASDLDQTEDVGVEDLVPVLDRHELERQIVALGPRVVDQHTETFGQVDRFRITHIETLDAHSIDEVRALGRIAHRRDGVEAPLRELDRDRSPDPPARACYYGKTFRVHAS